MGEGGYWEQTPRRRPAQLTETITIDPGDQRRRRAEVASQGRHRRLRRCSSPNAPGGGTRCDIEVRYALGRGESGIYAYAIFSHPATYGAMGVGESRYITKLNQAFDWISVDADRNMLECTPQDWGAGVVIHAKEQRILSTRLLQEFRRAQIQLQRRAIQDSRLRLVEHQGPHRRLVHQPDHRIPQRRRLQAGTGLPFRCQRRSRPDHPRLLARPATTAAARAATSPPAKNWSKVIGPIFVYCNALADPKIPSQADLDTLAATAGNPTVPPAWKDNATALWQDALAAGQDRKGPVALRLGQRRGLPAQRPARQRHRPVRAQ